MLVLSPTYKKFFTGSANVGVITNIQKVLYRFQPMLVLSPTYKKFFTGDNTGKGKKIKPLNSKSSN